MFEEDLNKHLSTFNTSPILFVGSGMSRRYLGLETWSDLLKKMVNELNLPKPFEYYYSISDHHLPQIASNIGNDFNEIWWSTDQFSESREDYSEIAQSKFSPLKYEICKYLTGITNVRDEYKSEINLFKKAVIDGIITTNWDSLLEQLFPDFTTYVGQDELIYTDIYSIGEIYKIHGSVSNPESLVLTSEDYESFHNRNPYLAAKLLTLFIEHPVIFMGYSLDDPNIQEILKSIIKCLSKDKVEFLKDRLIFCQWNSENEPTTFSDSTLLISDTIIPIKLIKIHNYTELYNVLAIRKKRLPVKVLKQMKGMVYDFVKDSSKNSNIYVAGDIDQLDDLENVEFVYGVGLKESLSEIGIKGIDTRDHYRDIILDNEWNQEKISRVYLPTLKSMYFPPFKYLRNAGFLNNEGYLDEDNEITEFSPDFVEKVNSIDMDTFLPPEYYLSKKDEILEKYDSFDELIADPDNTFLHKLMFTPLFSPKKISTDSLHRFLKSNLDKLVDTKHGTYYRKLICLYDYLKYSKQL